jgi:hypothetical protein
MRGIGVSIDDVRGVRALFGISNAEVTVAGQSVGGAPDESRAFLALGKGGALLATPTDVDGFWTQNDGSTVTRTEVKSANSKTTTLRFVAAPGSPM